jgi:hypothetical protein
MGCSCRTGIADRAYEGYAQGGSEGRDTTMTTQPTPVDPPQLHHSPAFAQGMIVPAGPTLYVGGQNGTDSTGALLDGLEAQTEQAMRNVLAELGEAGTGLAAPPLLSLRWRRERNSNPRWLIATAVFKTAVSLWASPSLRSIQGLRLTSCRPNRIPAIRCRLLAGHSGVHRRLLE